ncbi:MAG: hypothetical protein JO129_03120 [Candidatus Dependentiae bacterium]|nr:hypothetical protein [Candidatus Dependentiae bacterium]
MIHTNLTQERWNTFSIHQQLANVGTDVSRAIRWKNKGNLEYSQQALDRALELLDLTIQDEKYKGRGAFRELLRTREALKDYFLGDNQYFTNDEIWHNYFLHFNYAYAIEKGK